MSKPKILISAFACDPLTGSEPYVGWNWVAMLVEDFDVHVITRTYSQALIGQHPLKEKVTFNYFDLPGWSGRNHHSRFIKLYYILWQICILVKVWKLNQASRFDIIHHVTYNNIDVPGFLWLCPGARFVWGPVGGGQTAPHSLKAVYGATWWKECIRSYMKAGARYNPIVRLATQRASLVLFANEETAVRLKGLSNNSIQMLETGIVDEPAPDRSKRAPGPVRVLWLSYVFERKGLTLAIDSFAQALQMCSPEQEMELIVVGDGPALPAARSFADKLSGREKIKILGGVPHQQVKQQMQDADIFLFTSVQDTSGNVVLEAMRSGLPVIALNHQGAKVLLSGGAGVLVDVDCYDVTKTQIATAINKLVSDEDWRREVGLQARKKVVRHYTWASKREKMLMAYAEILSQRA